MIGDEGKQDLGAVILAGGEGSRLRPLTRLITGQDIPKQFCPLFGSITLLDQTRRRVSLAIPPRATVTVVTRSHECFYEPLLADAPPESVLVQPTNRGTAPAILYGLLKVAESNPAATIAIFPSDHYVSDDAAFMRHVELAVKAVEVCPKKTVLLGAWPTTPEVSYGWIEGGERLRVLPPSLPIFQVRRFWEKPSRDLAFRLLKFDRMWWNTFVIVARLPTLLDLIMRALPKVYGSFIEATSKLSRRFEPDVVNGLYEKLPSINLSDHVLASNPMNLAVLPLSGLEWSDLGEPSRVMALLEHESIRPKWAVGERFFTK